MSKTFILDTNVLLFDPQSIFRFGKNTVFIPLVSVEELDRFKKDQDENGRNARFFSRIVDELRKKGPLSSGVKLDHGGKLVIGFNKSFDGIQLQGLDLNRNDNLILATSLALKEAGERVILVTKDINLRLKADVLGLTSEDYGNRDKTLEELYSGYRVIELERHYIEKFEAQKFLSIEFKDNPRGNLSFFPNEYIIIYEKNNPNYRLFGRYSREKNGIIPLIPMQEGIWGIYPKNIEQQFAFDALLNKDVRLVSLVGKAGTGKTLLAIAAGLELMISHSDYSRVLVSRPIWPMGRDLGFLPGDINEKLAPWMQPIFDNLDYLFGKHKYYDKNSRSSWDDLIDKGLLHIEPLTYIRGRSIPLQFMIIDEAQNLTPHEIKTIITRVGDGSKIIFTGDCEQIDNPYLDSVNNGLAYSVEKFKGEKIAAHVTLKVGERSELSEIASKLL